jgi:hypothetical protein
MDLIKIAKAWISAANPTPKQEEIADIRINICNSCPSAKYLSILDVHVCGECNCPLKKKIFVDNKNECPLKKWTI